MSLPEMPERNPHGRSKSHAPLYRECGAHKSSRRKKEEGKIETIFFPLTFGPKWVNAFLGAPSSFSPGKHAERKMEESSHPIPSRLGSTCDISAELPLWTGDGMGGWMALRRGEGDRI